MDGFAYFSLFQSYIIYDHLKCVSRFRATLYFFSLVSVKSLKFRSIHPSPFSTIMYLTIWIHWLTVYSVCKAETINKICCFVLGIILLPSIPMYSVTESSITELVRPSVCPHGTRFPLGGFSWNLISVFFENVMKIQVSLKSDKNNGYFTWSPIYIFDPISLSSS